MNKNVFSLRWAVFWMTPLVLTSACSDVERFYVEDLSVSRTSWDTLTVSASFDGRMMDDEGRNQPDSLFYVVFDADFDTLYAGSRHRFGIPDADLGDEEAIMVEICGLLEGLRACSQEAILASPKRAVVEPELDYPLEPGVFERGAFDVDFRFQRLAFGTQDEWQDIRPRNRVESWFETYMEGESRLFVRIPITRNNSRFNMSRFQNYRDLRFGIESALLDADSAQVRFDLYARLGAEPVRLATLKKIVRAKSQEERRVELNRLIEQAGDQLLSRLKGLRGVRRGYVFVNDWDYVSLDKMYSAEFELHWQDSFRGEWSDMTARLQVRSDGLAGTVGWMRGSETARRRWDTRIEGDIYVLEPLFEERNGAQRVGDRRSGSRSR